MQIVGFDKENEYFEKYFGVSFIIHECAKKKFQLRSLKINERID